MDKIGFIGWRGLVGSVLLQRMTEENDFNDLANYNFTMYFFSTSQQGLQAPDIINAYDKLLDAFSIEQLSKMDVIISCQGSKYTAKIYNKLRTIAWNGYWIDAASHLRQNDQATLVLDPVNYKQIKQAIVNNQKTFVGANCTVSLMLMAVNGLLKHDLIEWINPTTYQAVSGSGTKAMLALLQQAVSLSADVATKLKNPAIDILALDRTFNQWVVNNKEVIYANNIIPCIDQLLTNRQTKEEHKPQVEANKLLALKPNTLSIDGLCARVGAMRCHSQALTIKLKQDITIKTIKQLLIESHPWIQLVNDDSIDIHNLLTPLSTSGTLAIKIGRIRKLSLGNRYLSLFTVADQLLWGAAEPLRRILRIILTDEVPNNLLY